MPTSPAICPGHCNAAWRRAEELGEPHSLQPIPGEPVHCWACYSTAHTQLAQLPGLFVSIYIEALHGTTTKQAGTIGRTGMHPAWPGQRARLFADGLIDGMLTLANDTREHLGEYVENRGHDRDTIHRSAATLTKHLRWLLTEHPCATETHGSRSGNPAWQIRSWHHSAEVFCRQDEQRTERRLAPCRRCNGPWLASVNGVVECRDPGCRLVMTNEEYAVYVERLAGAARHFEAAA
jgi:hypothetical protein